MSPSVHRTDCPICRGRDLVSSVHFTAIPVLCNALHPDAASARGAATGQFTLAYCRDCAHVFNAAFEADRIGYTQSYENSLHFSPRFAAFASDLARRLSATYALSGKTVVDIGCGKGDFLKELCSVSGARGIGFDKSYEEARGEEAGTVRFIKDWFSDAYPEVRTDFISCRHVLEHIAEPVEFLRALAAHPGISAGTVFYIEVPNALYTLRDMGIWDLIYEHVSYFTPASLRSALERAGFEMLAAGTSFGEQYLFIEARLARDLTVRQQPQVDGIEPLVRQFEGAYCSKVAHWERALAARDARRTVVWGAGSKGITFVNVVPGAGEVAALVDVNPHKQGRFAPGTATPVVAPSALRGEDIDAVIIMNPIYRNEIAETLAVLNATAEIIAA